MKITTSFLAVLSALTLAANLSAATKTWDGSASGFWTNAANWTGGIAPVNGDLLVFPVGPTRLTTTNTAGGATNFTALTFTGSNYVLRSSSLSITNGLTNAAPISSVNTLNAPIAPRASQTWQVAGKTTLVLNSNVTYNALTLTLDADGFMEANGNFAGGASANLTKLGAGRLEMNGAGNTLNQVRVGDGTLEVSGVLAASSLTISNGATLAGAGTGSVFTCAGEIRPGGSSGNDLGVLTISGASASVFQPGGRLQAMLHSPTPGAGYDQLKVAAVPNLAHGALTVLRAAGFPLSLGQKFVIVTNTAAGALTTTFTNLPQNARITNSLSPVTIFEISYTGGSGNDVELTVVDVAVTPTGVTRVWDAGGGNNRGWTNAANWDNNTLPDPGDDLLFPASVTGNSRITTNTFAPADATFNRLWYGGQGISWILRGGGLKLFGGIIGTNEFFGGEVQLRCANVELLGSQTWSSTNFLLDIGAPVLFGGYTLTVASEPGMSANFERELFGPGTLLVREGSVSLPFNLAGLGMSNITVRIEGGTVGANDAQATGPQWQLLNGILRFSFPEIPGLLATGGRIESFGINRATIAGNLTLAPACTVAAVFTSSNSQPLHVTGNVTLNGATLEAGPNSFSLLGVPLMLISNAGPNAVSGTFAGLPQGAVLAFTNFSGVIFLSRISYTGGDGNDVTLTPELPPATGLTRVWSGTGADALWATTANWIGNTPPTTGDDVRFPVNATQRANTNATPLTLNSMTWDGSNYLHAGTFALLDGLRVGAAAGTNEIAVRQLLTTLAPQIWAVSNATARLRVFGEVTAGPALNAAGGGGSAAVDGLGPITKTGDGVLELENIIVGAQGGVIVNGGTLRLNNAGLDKATPLLLQEGRIEALNAFADDVTATNGELELLFSVLNEVETIGGLFAQGGVTLGSNLTVSVHWATNAVVALGASTLDLNDARLNVLLPPTLPSDEVIRVAQYGTTQLTGTFANLPEGAVTNFAGRALQIRYNVSLPDIDPSTHFITLTPLVVAPRFTSVERLGNGDVVLRGTASAGATVFIEATQDFVIRPDLGSTLVNAAGLFTFIDSTGLPFRFYLARLP